MSADVKVKVLKPWNDEEGKREGDIVEVAYNRAPMLIEQGYAEAVKPAKKKASKKASK